MRFLEWIKKELKKFFPHKTKITCRMTWGESAAKNKRLDKTLRHSYSLWRAYNGGGFPSPKS